MSLTRTEWVEMWQSVKRMEWIVSRMRHSTNKDNMMREIRKIKEQIQSVIGQME